MNCMYVTDIIKLLVHQNFQWMLDEAKKILNPKGVFNGVILMDEISIQQYLQFVKKGCEWEIMGVVDLGEIVKTVILIQCCQCYCDTNLFLFMGLNLLR